MSYDLSANAVVTKGPSLSIPSLATSASVSSASSTKKHFLERTDPNFKRDLENSVGHVAFVVETMNKAFAKMNGESGVRDIQCRQLGTVCRSTVEKRRAFSDQGDVEINWMDGNGNSRKAILEVKQRRTPIFNSLAEFRYPSVLVDEKRLYDKIRNRGDTIGYLVTNYNCEVFLFVSHDDADANYETRTAMDRFKNRERTYVNVPKDLFVEGVSECALKMREVLSVFTPPSPKVRAERAVESQREKVRMLQVKVDELRKVQSRLEMEQRKLQEMEQGLE